MGEALDPARTEIESCERIGNFLLIGLAELLSLISFARFEEFPARAGPTYKLLDGMFQLRGQKMCASP
jgi:hypothetical protein